jgi:hypothetical protein
MNASNMAGTFAIIGAATAATIGGPIGWIAGGLIGGIIGFVLGGILGWIGGGKIAKAVDSSMKSLDKAWDESGIVGMLDLAFGAFYDGVIAKAFKIVNLITGGILKWMGLKELGQEIQDYEYSWDGIKQEITALFDELANVIKESIVSFINFFLPKELEINAVTGARSLEDEIEYLKSLQRSKIIRPKQFEKGGPMHGKIEKQEALIVAAGGTVKPLEPANQFEKDFGINASIDDIIDASRRRKNQRDEIKKLENEKVPPGNLTMMMDAKRISGDTVSVSSSTYTGTPRIDSLDATSNALLDWFRK